jgi:hypothetical protein
MEEVWKRHEVGIFVELIIRVSLICDMAISELEPSGGSRACRIYEE